MIKVLVACGNGMGTSMIIKMKAEQTFKKLGLDATIDHGSVGEATGIASNYDVVIVPENLRSQFKSSYSSGTKVIAMKNVLSQEEMIEKINTDILAK